MMRMALCGTVVAVVVGSASGQTVLYGVRANGDLLVIHPESGAAGVLGSTGVACGAAMGANGNASRFGWHGSVIAAGVDGVWADRLANVNLWTGAITSWGTTTGRPAGYTVHGMAVSPGFSTLPAYVLLKSGQPGMPDLLGILEQSYNYTVIGPTGRTDLNGLVQVAGALYSLGTVGPRALYSLDQQTGAAMLIGGGGYVGDELSLGYVQGRGLLACGSVLSVVNTSTGVASPVGPTGFTDIAGLATVTDCYANCDIGGPWPVLNVNDFICFQVKFANGDPYCNCDLSTVPPVLNVNDFVCFMNSWVAGCQ